MNNLWGNSDSDSGIPTHQSGTEMMAPEHDIHDPSDTYPISNDDNIADPAANGLYWFWDTMWDGTNCT